MQVVWFACGLPTIITNCAGNATKAFNTTLQWVWIHCGCHLIYNVINALFDSLRNHATNPTQAMLALLQEVLERSAVLHSHSIVA